MQTTRNSVLLLLVILVLPACTSQGPYGVLAAQPPIYPQKTFAHRVSSPDVDIYWNCSPPEAGLLRVTGVAQNTGGRDVRFLELQLEGVDAKDRNILEAAAAVPDIVLYSNQMSPFELDLRTAGSEVRFDLFYQYSIGSISRELHFMARDVCSETQHRVTSMGG
ncbi:MAG TPA: hypothetical protein VEU07_04645 [Candidatus Acidoferrum sp.]|nr:hypothetical protein [Candidatus Acidoferrum sp.]